MEFKDHIVPIQDKEIGKFRFRSEVDITKVYEVKILNNGSLSCNCGKKYGIDSRKHCKHISSVLKQIIFQFGSSISTCKKQSEINKMLDSLKI